MQPISRFENLEKAIQLEHDYEKSIYLEALHQNSIANLVVDGFVWYPLQIIDSGYSVGEYPYLTLEMDEQKLQSHKFKSGSVIQFFQNIDGDIHKQKVGATIYYVNRNRCKIIFEDNELPEWYDEGKIGIALDYDERTIKEMKLAMVAIKNAKDSPASDIRDIIYRERKLEAIVVAPFVPKNKNLNPSQMEAISNIIYCEDIAMVYGPPGTGKTTTLVEAIVQLAKKQEQILVTAASNSAVDLLVDKLHSTDLRVVRIGNISRVHEDIIAHTLDYKIEKSPEFQEIKKLRKRADEFRKMANKYKRKFGADEREQRRLLIQEVKEINKHILWIEDYLVAKIMDQAEVICTTLVGCESRYVRDRKFKYCVIDEASQALEPATWIPIMKSERVILAGDPFQLPPTVKNREAEKFGLNLSLMEQCFGLKSRVFLLDTQYRMKAEIMGFSNLAFYESKLKSAPNTDHNIFKIKDFQYEPLLFIDTAGCGFDEVRNEKTESLYNPDETKLLFDYLEKTLLELSYSFENMTIGVVAPYREQVIAMRQYDMDNSQLSQHYNMDIETIDSFQGQERDIIFISMVRSNEHGNIGFLQDYRRMNVAFTRAKMMLRVFGDSGTIGSDKFYQQWIHYIESIGGYKSAWEFL